MDNEPPAARRPGEMHSARPGLFLFCANLLMAAVLAVSYLLPSPGAVFRRQPASPGVTPTATTFDVSALPLASPTSAPVQTWATATATARPRAAAPTATRALPTATRTLPTVTPTPAPTVGVTPTPTPTVSTNGG